MVILSLINVNMDMGLLLQASSSQCPVDFMLTVAQIHSVKLSHS